MLSLVVVDATPMDPSVTHGSHEQSSLSEIRSLISELSPTKIESVIGLIYGNADIADATRNVRTVLGDMSDLRRMARNATVLAKLATIAHRNAADVVDEKDVAFFVRRANSIQDDLKSVLKYLDANIERSRTWLDLQMMHIATAYMEVYGRAFAITEHHGYMLSELALEYL